MLTKKNTGIGLMKHMDVCASQSLETLSFHINILKTTKEVWDNIASLFDKQDDLRVYQLKNELISLFVYI